MEMYNMYIFISYGVKKSFSFWGVCKCFHAEIIAYYEYRSIDSWKEKTSYDMICEASTNYIIIYHSWSIPTS